MDLDFYMKMNPIQRKQNLIRFTLMLSNVISDLSKDCCVESMIADAFLSDDCDTEPVAMGCCTRAEFASTVDGIGLKSF